MSSMLLFYLPSSFPFTVFYMWEGALMYKLPAGTLGLSPGAGGETREIYASL